MTRPITAPGRLVAGRYRLESQIAGGGMGTVWLARDELLGRQVAVKQIVTRAGTDARQVEEQRQRAMREGRIAARLSHPHAISVYDVALDDDQPWLVMEYLPSRSLAAVIREDGMLATGVVAQIGAQVADALAATHAAGIVHRDVKPANILIGEGGRIAGLVKITDFGISHATGDVTLTQTGQITGTPAFLSPEVAQGREMTEASDVFSLGATLYTCLEGQPPFGVEDNALAMLHRVAAGSTRPPLRAGPMAETLQRMLAADPADRPTMAQVRDELAGLAAGRDGDPTTVLLARTDLSSGTASRTPTSTFAPVGAAPAVQPAMQPGTPTSTTPSTATPSTATPTAVTPTAVAPAAPPAAAPDERDRQRRRGLWVGAAIAVLLAGLAVFWAVSMNDPDTSAPTARETPSATTSSAPTSAEETTDSDPTTAPPTTAEPTTEVPTEEPAPPPPPAEPLSAQNITAFLGDYHQQVLSDPRAAYARTGPTLRANISEADYIEYWQQFSDVRVRDISATDGQNTATGTLQWTYANGRTESGNRVFTFLVRDGQLILDSDFAA